MKLNIQKLLGAFAGMALVTTSMANSIQPAHGSWRRNLGHKVERSISKQGGRVRRSVYKGGGRLERSTGTDLRRVRRSVYKGGGRLERSTGTEVNRARRNLKKRFGRVRF